MGINLMPQRSLEYVAHHEAAHAVAALALGDTLTEVTIKPDAARGSAGHAEHLRGSNYSDPCGEDWWHFKQAVIAYAGHQATLKLGHNEDFQEAGAHDDYYSAAIHLDAIAGDDGVETKAIQQAANIVALCWGQIEDLAIELIEHQTLTGEAVSEALSFAR